jgi:hypothetical protein
MITAEQETWAERIQRELAAAPRPAAGDTVRRLKHQRPPGGDTHEVAYLPQDGVVLAVLDDPHAAAGWAAWVRWWWPGSERHTWETHNAWDFREGAGDLGVRVLPSDAGAADG